MQCRKESNIKNCPCDEMECPRRGVCCECVAYHRSRGSLTACMG